jgi:hypothetical protein
MTETTPATSTPVEPATGAGHGWSAAALAGACAIGLAVYQVAAPGDPAATYDSAADWVREGLFLTYLVTAVLTTALALRSRLVPRLPGLLVIAGYVLILTGVTIGMVLREDPAWFMALGGPGVLLSTGGFVAWAVLGWRRGLLPGGVALLTGVGGPVAILGSELGLSVLAGAFWLWLASQLKG